MTAFKAHCQVPNLKDNNTAEACQPFLSGPWNHLHLNATSDESRDSSLVEWVHSQVLTSDFRLALQCRGNSETFCLENRPEIFCECCLISSCSWSTWTISRKGSTGTIKVIDQTIKLKTLCTLFKMALAANLHYSCIAPTLPMYKNLSLLHMPSQRLQPSLQGAVELQRRQL